jgi:hypothetical protein
MKLDDDTRSVMKFLIGDGIFFPHHRSIDISKVLDEDNKLDLWLLEVTVRYVTKFLLHASGSSIKKMRIRYFEGISEYCSLRGIKEKSHQFVEELLFISNFTFSIADDETFQPPEQ